MTINDLSDLHTVPYSEVEGAYIKVLVEKTVDHGRLDEAPTYKMEAREGEIVGRGNGTGLYYDTKAKDTYETSIGPAVYIYTAEETTLEVRTDRIENELVEFKAQE